MAVAKKQTYIEAELLWSEQKLSEWRAYIDSNPIASLTDRMAYKETKGGGVMPMIVATIESQIKSIRDTTKEYLALLDVVNKMRQAEESKVKEAKGSEDVPLRMRGDK